jgi:hypothetical protein
MGGAPPRSAAASVSAGYFVTITELPPDRRDRVFGRDGLDASDERVI